MSEETKKEEYFLHEGTSIFRGKFSDKRCSREFLTSDIAKMPVVKAWLEDIDLIELSVCSSNLGFAYTFQKPYPGWRLP